MKKKVIIVIPAYNSEKTLLPTYNSIPKGIADEVLLVEDGSTDHTYEVGKKIKGLEIVRLPHNVGLGFGQKIGYFEALRRGADIVVLLHSDNQYDATYIPQMIKPIQEGKADLVLGSRIASGTAKKGGMPQFKQFGNRLLTAMFNIILGYRLSDAPTGYRVFSRRFLMTAPFLSNSNDHDFDSQVIVQAKIFKLKLKEIAVPTKYFEEASRLTFLGSSVFSLLSMKALFIYILWKVGLKKARFLTRKVRSHQVIG